MFQLNQPTKKQSIKKTYLNKQAGYVAVLITKLTIRQMHRKQNWERNKRY